MTVATAADGGRSNPRYIAQLNIECRADFASPVSAASSPVDATAPDQFIG